MDSQINKSIPLNKSNAMLMNVPDKVGNIAASIVRGQDVPKKVGDLLDISSVVSARRQHQQDGLGPLQ